MPCKHSKELLVSERGLHKLQEVIAVGVVSSAVPANSGLDTLT